jgi:TrmH family RNA methyltransferase
VPEHLSKNQITTYRKLAQRKYREKFRLYLAEGLRTILQLIRSDVVHIECIIIQEGIEISSDFDKTPIFIADKSTFSSLTDTEQSQGVLAVCRMMNEVSIHPFLDVEDGLILALDGLQDPGNLGTIIRTSAWFGATGLLLGSGTVDYYNPKVVRSTAGGLEVVPHLSCDLYLTLPELIQYGWEVVLLDMGNDAVSMIDWRPGKKVILVVGNEGAGVSDELRVLGHQKVCIDGHSDQVESLNAGIAAAIGLFKIASRGR